MRIDGRFRRLARMWWSGTPRKGDARLAAETWVRGVWTDIDPYGRSLGYRLQGLGGGGQGELVVLRVEGQNRRRKSKQAWTVALAMAEAAVVVVFPLGQGAGETVGVAEC